MAQPLSDRPAPSTVLLIDSCPAARIGLRMALETEPDVRVIGEAGTVAEGLRFLAHDVPHVIVLDLDLSAAEAAADVRQLIAQCPACVVILLALSIDPVSRAELMSAGAAACVEKDLPENLLKTFRDVRRRSTSPS